LKKRAVSFLAEQIGVTIGNPCNHRRRRDIERLAEEIAISAMRVRLSATPISQCAETMSFDESGGYAPRTANVRHSMFEDYVGRLFRDTPDFNVLSFLTVILSFPGGAGDRRAGRQTVCAITARIIPAHHFHPQRLRDCTAKHTISMASSYRSRTTFSSPTSFIGSSTAARLHSWPGRAKTRRLIATSPLTTKFNGRRCACAGRRDRIITSAISKRSRPGMLVPSTSARSCIRASRPPLVMSYLRSTLVSGLRQASVAPKAGDRVYVSRVMPPPTRRNEMVGGTACRCRLSRGRLSSLRSLTNRDFANADSVIGCTRRFDPFCLYAARRAVARNPAAELCIPTCMCSRGFGGEYLSYVTTNRPEATSFDDVAVDIAILERCRDSCVKIVPACD